MKKFRISIDAPTNDWRNLSDYYRIAAETAAAFISDQTGEPWTYNRGGDIINDRHHERRIRVSWEFNPHTGYTIEISAGYHGPANIDYSTVFLSKLKSRIISAFETV